MQLWDRQPDETAEAYRAFTFYRDLPPGQRSLERAGALHAEANGGRQTARGRPTTTIERWSSRFQWVNRAEAFDAYLETLRRAELERAERADATKWAARRIEERDSEWDLRTALIEKAKTMLAFPLTVVVTETETDPISNRVYQKQVIQPARWTLNTARLMVETAVKIGRMGAEMEVAGMAGSGMLSDAEGEDKPFTIAEWDRIARMLEEAEAEQRAD
jgi:hypothetical protein